jgi:hypothetical protein
MPRDHSDFGDAVATVLGYPWSSRSIGGSPMNEDGYNEWYPLVKQAAKNVAGMFPDSEVEDLEQACWEGLLVYQRRGKMFSPNEQYAKSTLYFIAKTVASKVRAEHLTLSPQYAYRTADITDLLEYFFEPEYWSSMPVPVDAESELGNVGMEMGADLSRAWDNLCTEDKEIIFLRYALGHKIDNKKVSRAVGRMATYLNKWKPQEPGNTGNRKVITNSTAASRIADLT